MSNKKLSGAQLRKRKREQEADAKKYGLFMQQFLKQRPAEDDDSDESDMDKLEQEAVTVTDPPECHQLDDTLMTSSTQSQPETSESDSSTQAAQATSQNKQCMLLDSHDFGYIDFDSITGLSNVADSLRMELVSRGPQIFQNKDADFAVCAGRSMTLTWFKRSLPNGEEVNRSWLLYSPSKKSAYCFCCVLFTSSSSNSRSSFELSSGFSNWRHTERLKDHETSPSHRTSFTKWKEMEHRISQGTLIDVEVEKQIQNDRQKWREVLKRIVACIKFLASQNLALRGHCESLAEHDNTECFNIGNFLATMKLIAQFDPLLSNHLQHAMDVPGSVSYLSPRIQNEFISLLASTVRRQILCDIRRNKYYGLMLDSTPDLAHREQLSEVIRFVDVNFITKKVTIKEAFLGFIQLHAKDAATLESVIVEQLQADNLPLTDCRSQCYDNAAVMAGELSGLQQRISIRNPRALFVNCNNHSLNLAGLHAAKQDPVVVTFFGTVENLYVFFSASTVRWEKMRERLEITLKRECQTRWSARHDAVKAMQEQFDGLLQLLEDLYEDGSQTNDTQNDAYSLLQNVINFNFITLLNFWHTVLSKIDRVQKRLQDPSMNFHDAALDLEGLQQQLSSIREDVCITAVTAAKDLCEKLGIRVEGRIRRQKQMPGENARDARLSAVEEITRIMKSVIDRLIQEITTRFGRLKTLDEVWISFRYQQIVCQ
jgi:hypothetical protein